MFLDVASGGGMFHFRGQGKHGDRHSQDLRPFGPCLLSPHSSNGRFVSLDLMCPVSRVLWCFFGALRLEMKLSLTKLRSFEVTYLQSNVTRLQIFGFVSISFPFHLFNIVQFYSFPCFILLSSKC